MFSAFRGLGRYIAVHRRAWALGFLFIVGAVFAGLYGPPRIVGLVVDRLRAGGATTGEIAALAGLVVLSAAAASLLFWVSRRLVLGAARRIVYAVRRDVFERLTLQDQGYFHRTRTGDIMSRLTGDLNAVQEMLSFGVFHSTNALFTITGSLALMIGLSLPLGLIAVGVFPFIVGFLFVMTRVIARRYVRVQEQQSLISARAQENFSGIRVVKGYAIEDREIRDYTALNEEYRRRVLSLARVEGPLWGTVGLLMNLVFIGVLLVGSRQLILGGQGGSFGGLTIGEFVTFTFYLFTLSWPVLALGFTANVFQRAASSWNRLRELLEVEPAILDDGRTDPSIDRVEGEIVFDRVSLRANGRTLLSDLSLRVPKGQTLGITGRTGSGKTLLASLVWRALDPSSGRVLVDGHDLRTVPLRVLRESIGAVPQEPFLFSDTIAENIAFGLPERVQVERELEPDPATVRWAAGVAGLAKDVEDFPKGYDTMLGERGVTLSGGQRQRTALARALARRPKILILDDSMSAVDTETESRILGALKTVLEGRTVLLIGHRVSTLRHADHIVVLEGGRIVEQGSHEELLAQGGLYAEMDRKQGLSGELEGDDGGVGPGAASLEPAGPGGAARGERR